MKLKKILLSLGIGLVLVGCDSRIDAVNQQMADIRNQPPQAIEPAPVFTPVPRFNYAAYQFSRAPQPLESYALESLNMKGSMRNSRGQVMALIQTPDHQIERVQVGNYIGMNQGRITHIGPTQIDLVEIVPDGREGYVERPRTLVLIGPAP